MTVKEAFSLAYGEVPEEASCHLGWEYKLPSPSIVTWRVIAPRIDVLVGRKKVMHFIHCGKGWYPEESTKHPIGPDISSRPASAFVGFFGEEFDSTVASISKS